MQKLTGIYKGIEWRLKGIARKAYRLPAFMLAFLHRPWLRKTVFIGITGSAGKTTTKELIAGILEHVGSKGQKNPGSYSFPYYLARLVLSTRASDAFCVAEIGLSHEFRIRQSLAIFRPTVGVVTNIGDDHIAAYGSRDGIANEKKKLIRSLPQNGVAVLNADDPRVLAMRSEFPGRIITYGTSADAMMRAEAIKALWPDRLSFTVSWSGQSVRVQTRLCGSHWMPVVLAALTTAVALDIPLAIAAQALGTVEPFEGRMSPVLLEDGITFIRDDWKAPVWTIGTCFEFMRAARAARKIIVVGEISDLGALRETHYAKIAGVAQEIADIVVFVGPKSFNALKARKPGAENAFRVFGRVKDAADYINSIARAGDLILLKGTARQDHLFRIILARSGAIACWRDDCKRHYFCNECPSRDQPSSITASLWTPAIKDAATSLHTLKRSDNDSTEQIVVGLGNPEPKYYETPHNIGYAVVDKLAASMQLKWEEYPDAWIARGSNKGKPLCLVKIKTAMNLIGAGLKHLSENMGFSPEQCILVFDDINLPLGSVRQRINGTAGGHNGVSSIIEAFQTDAVRRVKIGVRKTETGSKRVEYLLKPFAKSDRVPIDQSILDAGDLIINMVKNHNKSS